MKFRAESICEAETFNGKGNFFFFSGRTKEMGNWNWISVVTGHLEGIDVQGKYDFQHSVYIGQVWLTCILPKKIGMAYIGQLFDFDSLTHLVL